MYQEWRRNCMNKNEKHIWNASLLKLGKLFGKEYMKRQHGINYLDSNWPNNSNIFRDGFSTTYWWCKSTQLISTFNSLETKELQILQ